MRIVKSENRKMFLKVEFFSAAVMQSHRIAKKSVVMNCDQCPMVWFQKLLAEIEGRIFYLFLLSVCLGKGPD